MRQRRLRFHEHFTPGEKNGYYNGLSLWFNANGYKLGYKHTGDFALVHQHSEVNQTHPLYVRKPLGVVGLDVSTYSTLTGRMQFTLVLNRCFGLFPAL